MNNYFNYSESSEGSEISDNENFDNETFDSDFIINNNIINNISIIRQNLQNLQNRQNTLSDLSFFINTSFDLILDNLTSEFYTEFNFMDNLEDVKVTLSNEQINKLQKIKLDENNIINYTNNCSICLESCNINEDLLVLKCNHYFHYTCIHPWLTKESTKCPTCRHPST